MDLLTVATMYDTCISIDKHPSGGVSILGEGRGVNRTIFDWDLLPVKNIFILLVFYFLLT